jgi:hypothetical protein
LSWTGVNLRLEALRTRKGCHGTTVTGTGSDSDASVHPKYGRVRQNATRQELEPGCMRGC